MGHPDRGHGPERARDRPQRRRRKRRPSRRRPMSLLVVAVLLLLVVIVVGSARNGGNPSRSVSAGGRMEAAAEIQPDTPADRASRTGDTVGSRRRPVTTLAQDLGQMMVVRFRGGTPSLSLRRR